MTATRWSWSRTGRPTARPLSSSRSPRAPGSRSCATSATVILSMFLGALVWSLGVGVLAAMAVGILLQGFGFAAANSMQQARLVAAAPELSSATVALNTSSIYVGQALGSALGGFLFEHEHLVAVGYATAAFFAAALAVLALTRRRAGSLAGKA